MYILINHKRSSDKQNWLILLGTKNMSQKGKIGHMKTPCVVKQAVHSFNLILYVMLILLYLGYSERENLSLERKKLRSFNEKIGN